MKAKKKHLLYWIFFSITAFFYIYLRIFSESVIDFAYTKQWWDFLNSVADSKINQDLPFYYAQFEVNLFGPIKSFLSGVLFLSFCLFYLKNSKASIFGLAVFIYLFLTRFEVLWNPPFGEAITGLFIEAIWLLQNSLDYVGLHKAGIYHFGGPQFYPTSIYSFIVAVIMKLIPSRVLFYSFMHLVAFMLGAGIIALLRELLSKYFSKDISLLGALLVLFYPLFQSMVELINLEISLTFAVILSVYFLVQQRFIASAFMAILAMLIKGYGMIACFSFTFASFYIFITEFKRKKRFRLLLGGIGVFGLAVIKTLIRSHFMGGADQPVNNQVRLFSGWHNFKIMPWPWIFLIVIIILLGSILIQMYRQKWQGDKILSVLNNHYPVVMIYSVAGFWFLIFLNYNVVLYRYQFIFLPFLMFAIIYSASLVIKSKKVIPRILIIFIIAALVCSHGFPYRTKYAIATEWQCIPMPVPSCIERSLEYRNYMVLEKNLVKEIEENYSDFTIIAPWGVAQILGLPDMGYSDMQMDARTYAFDLKERLGLKKFEGMFKTDPRKTIFITYKHVQEYEPEDFPMDLKSGDRVVKELSWGKLGVYIFQGGVGIEKKRIVIELYRRGLLDEFKDGKIDIKEAMKHL